MLGILTREKSKRIYPRQFWLLFCGVFLNRASFSLVWPFLTVFLTQEVGMSLTTVTLLISLRSFSSLVATSFVAPMMDRFGRKSAMIVGMASSAVLFVVMSQAQALWLWAVLMVAHGVVMPMFNIGVYSMVADMIAPENRTSAYALIRVVANAGIAVGPIVGGILIAISFSSIFIFTAIGFMALALLIYGFMPETHTRAGYSFLLKDRVFLGFVGAFFFTEMASVHMFTLLNVYLTNEFGMLPSEYSLLVTINAVMVVVLQYGMTRYTRHYNHYVVMAFGSLVYCIGILSVAFGGTFAHFAISMVIVTLGELIVSPTAMTLVANHAPADMRARYMGVLEIMYPVATGIGPVIGGFLNDNVAPVAMWYNAAAMTLIGAVWFLWLARGRRKQMMEV
jgi:MFS family permease